VFVVIVLTVAALTFALRRSLARRGSGRLAQVAFRKAHGAQVARLLDGEVDPRPHSPWIAIEVDGRPARLVAAPVPGGRMQAGIELFERAIPVNVWFTNGDRTELDVPDHIDEDAVLEIVARLGAANVDSCSTTMPIRHAGDAPHVLRMQFDEVSELPAQLARVAPLLTELEALGPRVGDA
jgi:hypothetical protein